MTSSITSNCTCLDLTQASSSHYRLRRLDVIRQGRVTAFCHRLQQTTVLAILAGAPRHPLVPPTTAWVFSAACTCSLSPGIAYGMLSMSLSSVEQGNKPTPFLLVLMPKTHPGTVTGCLNQLFLKFCATLYKHCISILLSLTQILNVCT